MLRSRVLASVGLILALVTGAGAEEWYEAYQNGVKALAQGQAQRAIPLIEFAAGQRPQPGRDVLTYGTNVERQYFPYLRLAAAYLQMRDLAGARSALRRSERWAVEPAEERRRLAGQVEELAARLAPPTPAPAPPETAPPTTMAAAPPTTTLAAAPAPAEQPARPTPAPTREPPSPAAGSAAPARTPTPAATPPPVVLPSDAPPGTRSIEVVSQPPGASVYLDDELIGNTDPEWGRLVRRGIRPGPHRIRLTLVGHRDVSEEVLIGGTERTDFRRRLTPDTPLVDGTVLLIGAVAVVLLGLTAWALRRSSVTAPDGTMARGRIFAPTPAPSRGSGPGMPSPGIRRDAEGREFFGDYRLIELLGRGGMASVFKAERGRELCALKRPLTAFLEEPEFLERFLREAEIGRTLHHPNIIRILDRGEWEGVPYFTMELVPGETLQALVQRQGALEPARGTHVVVQVAEALDYAHLKGVVHRDLKPSNVMVLPDGGAKVMDYGIARARRFEGLTTTGSFLGSPEYVAPETIEGKGTEARSDLYSLGVMFYEILAGRRPFAADSPFAILRMHLAEPPPLLSAVRPGVPPDLERIVQRLLAKTPEERYTSAEDLLVELRDFLNRAG